MGMDFSFLQIKKNSLDTQYFVHILRIYTICCGYDIKLNLKETNMPKTYRPGEKAPASGQYEIVGPRGGKTGEERTVVRGEPMPPTPSKRQQYKIVDRTKNKSGKG